jgi:hypothetical protein
MDIQIKKVPQWLVQLRIIPDTICFALAPYIFLNAKLYQDYLNGSSMCLTKALIAHESVHIKREQAMGLWKFLFLYFFSKKFCFDEEIEAIKEEMRIYKSCNEQFDTDRKARVLSSFWMYHHCTSYEDAKKILDALWHQT